MGGEKVLSDAKEEKGDIGDRLVAVHLKKSPGRSRQRKKKKN